MKFIVIYKCNVRDLQKCNAMYEIYKKCTAMHETYTAMYEIYRSIGHLVSECKDIANYVFMQAKMLT